MAGNTQRLIPRSLASGQNSDKSEGMSIEEGIKASVKDPLWYLARQWQLGEFTAGNCGSIAEVRLSTVHQKISKVWQDKPKLEHEIERSDIMPLEPYVEASDPGAISSDSDPPALVASQLWKSANLEYQFSIGTSDKATHLTAKEYYGEQLDWYNFEIKKTHFPDALNSYEDPGVTPKSVTFPGMPKARWWRYEDAQVDLGDIQRPNLNFLSMLLIEFALLYSNDWFLIPVAQSAGSLRKVHSLKVVDVFGESTTIPGHKVSPDAINKDKLFTLFTLEENEALDSSYLFLPNTLTHYIQGEPLEEVVFFRDEMANLVWAVERKYFDGEIINREDIEAAVEKDRPEPAGLDQKALPLYKIISPLPQHWIPYLSVQSAEGNGQTYFRRGRTIASASDKQYKSHLITDSSRIMEEEIPSTPIVLTQNAKMAVYDTEEWTIDTQGNLNKNEQNTRKRLIWVGRKKNHGLRMTPSGLKSDYLIE